MAAIILMIVATVGIVLFFVKTGKAGKTSAAEIVLSRAWSNRFSRIDLEGPDFENRSGRKKIGIFERVRKIPQR